MTAAAIDLHVRLALADLRAALQYHNDRCFYAYRAVESMRQCYLKEGKADRGTARERSWEHLRSTLHLDQGEL